jgi:hypothetical protein
MTDFESFARRFPPEWGWLGVGVLFCLAVRLLTA